MATLFKLLHNPYPQDALCFSGSRGRAFCLLQRGACSVEHACEAGRAEKGVGGASMGCGRP